mmetsp:Transcript_27349/g.63781  ORF Transcript_27349/g.63781 Transcript_27349/m.63781 type:complete len:303 (+) Transcript_27349:120-1028(+)
MVPTSFCLSNSAIAGRLMHHGPRSEPGQSYGFKPRQLGRESSAVPSARAHGRARMHVVPLVAAATAVVAASSRSRRSRGSITRQQPSTRSRCKTAAFVPGALLAADLAACAWIAPSGPAMDLLHLREGPNETALLIGRYAAALSFGWMLNTCLPSFVSKAMLRSMGFIASVSHLRNDLAAGDWTVSAFAHVVLLFGALLIGPAKAYPFIVIWLSLWHVPREHLRHIFSSGRFDRSAVRFSLIGSAIGMAAWATRLYRHVPEWLLISGFLAHFYEDSSLPQFEEDSDDEMLQQYRRARHHSHA